MFGEEAASGAPGAVDGLFMDIEFRVLSAEVLPTVLGDGLILPFADIGDLGGCECRC